MDFVCMVEGNFRTQGNSLWCYLGCTVSNATSHVVASSFIIHEEGKVEWIRTGFRQAQGKKGKRKWEKKLNRNDYFMFMAFLTYGVVCEEGGLCNRR